MFWTRYRLQPLFQVRPNYWRLWPSQERGAGGNSRRASISIQWPESSSEWSSSLQRHRGPPRENWCESQRRCMRRSSSWAQLIRKWRATQPQRVKRVLRNLSLENLSSQDQSPLSSQGQSSSQGSGLSKVKSNENLPVVFVCLSRVCLRTSPS